MTYTCRSCSQETDNDSDVCDDCAAYCIICDGPCTCQPAADAVFIAAILKADPMGSGVMVAYHPNGDWSVYEKTVGTRLAALPPATEKAER